MTVDKTKDQMEPNECTSKCEILLLYFTRYLSWKAQKAAERIYWEVETQKRETKNQRKKKSKTWIISLQKEMFCSLVLILVFAELLDVIQLRINGFLFVYKTAFSYLFYSFNMNNLH